MVVNAKDKLKSRTSAEITELFEKVLDFAEVAIPSPETYKRFRSKVLRIGNNAIRCLHKYIDEQTTDVTEYECTIHTALCRCQDSEPHVTGDISTE